MIFKAIQKDRVQNVIENAIRYSDNYRLDVTQFHKYFNETDGRKILWYGCFENAKCMALSVLMKLPYMGNDIILLAEIQSFVKGYGKALIENILSRASNIWWCAEPSGGRSLVDYYRQFGLREHVIGMSKWTNTPEHAFYKASDKYHENIIVSNLRKADLEIEYGRIFDEILFSYMNRFGFDLSYMKFIISSQPLYNDGSPCFELEPNESGGNWTRLGFIRLNPDMQSVMKKYGLYQKDKADIEHFTRIIIAHELAHEIWNNAALDDFKRQILNQIEKTGFTTAYLKTVKPSKYDEEGFCEYLAHAIDRESYIERDRKYDDMKLNKSSKKQFMKTYDGV